MRLILTNASLKDLVIKYFLSSFFRPLLYKIEFFHLDKNLLNLGIPKRHCRTDQIEVTFKYLKEYSIIHSGKAFFVDSLFSESFNGF